MLFFAALGALLSIPFLVLYGTWAWAVVIQKTWAWFTVPAFSVAPITFTQAIAISVFVSIFFVKATHTKTEKNEDGSIKWDAIISSILTAMILPWFVLLLNLILACIFI